MYKLKNIKLGSTKAKNSRKIRRGTIRSIPKCYQNNLGLSNRYPWPECQRPAMVKNQERCRVKQRVGQKRNILSSVTVRVFPPVSGIGPSLAINNQSKPDKL